jgi:hypothetical protein
MSPFKVEPRKQKPAVDPAKLAEFALGAESPKESTEGEGARGQKQEKPNFDLLDDKRRLPAFVMRFTEKELAKLKHITETTNESMHQFCLKAIQKSLDQI